MDDAVVVGAGPNGLVAANVLADAGWSVTVVEGEGQPGGAVRSGELTLPGYRHDLFSAFYPLAVASPALRQLRLEEHGLRWCRAPVVLAHPLPDGRCAVLAGDVEATAASLDGFCAGDGGAWMAMADQWQQVGDDVLGAIFRPFPPVVPMVKLGRRLGVLGSLRFGRQLLLPVRTMAEEQFGGAGGALLLGGNALHSDLSPESAGSGLYGWLLSCLAQQHGYPVPEGGAGELTASLVRRLEAAGGVVRCGSPVVDIVVRHQRAVGVRCAGGEVIAARRAVVADVSAPALYTSLLRPEHVPPSLLDDLQRFQWDTSTVKVDWALDRPIPWLAEPARQAGTIHVADDFDNLTEFSAHLAMGLLPSRPFLVLGQQSVSDPTRSPPGTETAWAYTHIPRTVRGDAAAELETGAGERGFIDGFVQRIEKRIEALAPGFEASVRGRHVLTPTSLQSADPNLHRGAINGGTAQLHQQLVFRPVPGAGRAETPVAGLYLASSSAHPGGGVHGAGGANAARAALLAGQRLRAHLVGALGRHRSTGGALGWRGRTGGAAG